MEYAIISDIHGCADALQNALNTAKQFECATILILGDILYHGPRNALIDGYDPQKTASMLNKHKDNIIAVKGNCDAEVDQMLLEFPIMSPTNTLIFQDRKIFMTHGHQYKPGDVPLKAGDLFLSGHTHRTVLETFQGIYVFNPGSISMPKGTNIKTMGILSEKTGLLKLVDTTTGKILQQEKIS